MFKKLNNSKEKQMKEKLHYVREQIIFKLLINNGINLESFINSPIYNNPNNYYLIEHIYAKLDGYDYYKVIMYDKERNALIKKEENDFNGHIMDLNKVQVSFDNDILTIFDDEVKYTYEIDENCRYYLNGEELKLGRVIKQKTGKVKALQKTREYFKKKVK